MSVLLAALRPLVEALPSNPVAAGAVVVIGAIALTVILNVAQQFILPRSSSAPPLVLHYFPVIGSAVSYGIDPYKFLADCRQKYGDVFTFVLLGRKVTVALGPPGSNLVLNGKLAHVSAEEAYTHLTTPVFGTDVVYDCPNHVLMEQKKFVKFGLNTENFRKYVQLITDEVLLHLKTEVFSRKSVGDGKYVRDAYDMSSEITICSASATLQGPEVRASLDKSFADLYHDLDGGFTPINFVFPNLPLPSYRRRDVAHVKMRNFYLDIMKKRRDGEANHDGETDMLQALQGQTYKDGRALPDKEIAHIMIALLMAGQHTSAATGSWLLLHIGDRQDLFASNTYRKALYEEQVKYYGEPDGTLRPLDYENLQTPLLNACMKEVLRMHPPIHSIMRAVVSDISVPPSLSAPSESQAYVIPKGHYVLASPGFSQMDPAHWDNVDKFDPYRWLNPDGVVKADEDGPKEDFGFGTISTGANSPYLPFGAGRHRCIGETFAFVQLGTIVATMIRETEWTLEGGKVPDQDYTTMLVNPKKPRNVIFKRRAPATKA